MFVGDFIFTFYKPLNPTTNVTSAELKDFKQCRDDLIKNHVSEKITESELREKAHRAPNIVLGKACAKNVHECRETVKYSEMQMRRLEPQDDGHS